MTQALTDGNRIEIRRFGSFSVREYGGYTGRDPKTGELIDVGARKIPFFKAGKELWERVNSGKM